jgi:hypothetical protein
MISPLKEQYFLEYNKENIASNLIQSEAHLRRIEKGPIQGGHANCVVKHSLDSEGECREATSHALVVESGEKSQKFKLLGDNIRNFRKRLQKSKTEPFDRDEAILQVRDLRSEFESFNPEFDVSECESCGTVGPILERIERSDNPKKEKVLNSSPTNRKRSDGIMKNIAVVYGANFAGKLLDEVVMPMLPTEANLPVTVGLAAGLPIIAKIMKLGDASGTLATVVGAYESTKLWEILESYMAPPAARAVVQARQVAPPVIARAAIAQPMALSKYTVS